MAEQFHRSLAAFDTNTQKKVEPLYESFDRFNDYCSVLGELYDEFGSEVPDRQHLRSDEEMALHRIALSDQLDNMRAKTYVCSMGGSLSVETEERRRFLSILAFTFLANVKWKGNLFEPRDIQDAIQTGELYFSHLRDRATSRRVDVGLANSIVKLADKMAIAPDDALAVLTNGLRTIFAGRNGQMGNDLDPYNFLSRLRSGKRWKELKDLFGAEILLLGSPAQMFRRSPSLLLDIPGAVEAASDSQFSELKQMMSTEFGWLKETCVKLGGVYQMIQALDKANGKEAKAHSDRIQSRIHTIFGGTSFIHRITLTDSTLLDPFPLVLRTRRVLCEGPSSIEGSRQVILDFLIRQIAVIYWDGMSLKSKAELRQMVDEVLVTENYSTSMKDWTLKALDSLYDAFDAETGCL
jgi:hypothetical protein